MDIETRWRTFRDGTGITGRLFADGECFRAEVVSPDGRYTSLPHQCEDSARRDLSHEWAKQVRFFERANYYPQSA